MTNRLKALFDELVTSLSGRSVAGDMTYMLRPHGFVFPANMPPCSICNEGPNAGSHVNPPRTSSEALALGSMLAGRRNVAADKVHLRSPRRTHTYTTGYAGWLSSIPCVACGQKMGASAHTPGMPVGPSGGTLGDAGVSATQTAAVNDPGAGQIVMVRHKFEALEGQSSTGADYQMCAKCGFAQDDEVHEVDGKGDADDATPKVVVKQLAWAQPKDPANVRSQTDVQLDPQRAFVTQLGGKLILSGPAEVFTTPDESMPRELAAQWERASEANPHFMWLEGRYVEADRPNRNMAAWSAEDLELGEPTVAHGPLNMLHAERHIVGTIAAAKLVVPDRQVAATANEPANIRALAAVWRYLFPSESRQIARASDERKLWYSMECVSREVACLAEGCVHIQGYGEYMTMPQTRCQHVKAGGPRRFADPHFLGGGIIIPPIRPGWAGANATVLRQAAMLAERQEASLTGLTEEEAVSMLAQIVAYAGGDAQ